jgi:hypothetical protein
MNMKLDEYKLYRRSYRNQERNKIRRMRKFYEKLQARKQKLVADNQTILTYSSGMAGPFAKDQKEEDDTLKRKRTNHKTNNDNVKCNKCGLMGHVRSNSSKCMYNNKKWKKKRSELMRPAKKVRTICDMCVSMYTSFLVN